jgi:hypothetical protein
MSIAMLNVTGWLHWCVYCRYAGQYIHQGTFFNSLDVFLKMDVISKQPIPEAALLKAWVCGRSLAGIVGLNPADGTDVCLL